MVGKGVLVCYMTSLRKWSIRNPSATSLPVLTFDNVQTHSRERLAVQWPQGHHKPRQSTGESARVLSRNRLNRSTSLWRAVALMKQDYRWTLLAPTTHRRFPEIVNVSSAQSIYMSLWFDKKKKKKKKKKRHSQIWACDGSASVSRTKVTGGSISAKSATVVYSIVRLHWYSCPDLLVFCARMHS